MDLLQAGSSPLVLLVFRRLIAERSCSGESEVVVGTSVAEVLIDSGGVEVVVSTSVAEVSIDSGGVEVVVGTSVAEVVEIPDLPADEDALAVGSITVQKCAKTLIYVIRTRL